MLHDDLLRWVEEVNRFDDQGRKTGKWMTFWPNGAIRKEGPFERGLEEGVFKFFPSRRGDLERRKRITVAKSWRTHPKRWPRIWWKAFYPNGNVSREGPWREDTPMGTHRYFDEAGHLVEVKVFRSGVLQASGMLDSLGRRTGPWIEFWPDGEPKAQGPYVAGEREGDWQFFARDGRLEQEGSYCSGQMAWTLEAELHVDGRQLDERYRKDERMENRTQDKRETSLVPNLRNGDFQWGGTRCSRCP